MEGQKHTAGSMAIHPNSKTSLVVGKRVVAACGGYQSNLPGEDAHGECEANARRVAATWNACEGISTEALESGAVPSPDEAEARATAHYADVLALRNQLGEKAGLAKELAGALEDMRVAFANAKPHPAMEETAADVLARACATLDKAKAAGLA